MEGDNSMASGDVDDRRDEAAFCLIVGVERMRHRNSLEREPNETQDSVVRQGTRDMGDLGELIRPSTVDGL